ncbi:hypothetical protein [Clostridium tetani]|uniref:hypothetical protein n=2 Tax=Clostridium tetani TaxID=1513 RepID=UPI000512FEC0|nr:hypothetical protein [Clostridium tetani]KGI44859.1 hypothetical protein KY55_02545 [Clostridium tetani]
MMNTREYNNHVRMEEDIWFNKINNFNINQHYKIEYTIFNQNDFYSSCSEQRIIIYNSKDISNNISLFDFAINCLYMEYKLEEKYLSKDDTWDNRKILYKPKEISLCEFYETYCKYKTGLTKKPSVEIIENQIVKAYELYREWDYTFQIAETNDKYYAFSWETTA